MPQIHYLPDDRAIEIDDDDIILEASLRAGIPHTHACGGSARCSTCRVLIVEGLEFCSPRNSAEDELANKLRLEPEIRLACQTQVAGGKVILRRLAIDSEDLETFNDEIAGNLISAPVGQEKKIAILFADIRGFTAFAESLLPYDVIYILNRYFQKMGYVINRNGGMINNYMGDGFMALFGLENSEKAAEQAVRAGVEMLEELDKLNPYFETLYSHRLRIGIGIHCGLAVVGNLGAKKNQTVTAIGDAVNFASRIEAANKQVGTSLLISEETYEEIKDLAIVNQCVSVKIPGKSGEYPLYEVVGMPPLPVEIEEIFEVEKSSFLQGFFKNLMGLLAALRNWIRKIFGS
ncbi:MAG: adenylate/guanylate cyclase domain-containing protein [Microcoleus sp. PH2017_01_SCD_O_A]|jgi:adenylate cyclase|uniref:adenylate/guanylate cyclase domain-containing protein n=1 Tax=unclassified Microcoleus TaxID=2642155 RepID=UPI001D5553F8|nr:MULTISPECIES: adenylate/guanylate cyclase domain-containing protein [unclassified Microcoleus]MCC3420854.1 adenylate/guanylate cyclase domain-containing protein [Microcoleus sp. PH2017_07_MST_O_A]MCC3433079.1 adenylate/guanylate cyclase domain-containing protein [Microcoleus sp. PH2017_04_SCI_O_A]MCC3509371.1 adenylate/guanylate cyclase domain-containing protein [Microcoleus sp. PH2017_17_BER_D_A]TAE64972.1 MAG: adenylate/guanylate cyclase domain-containing protein [Oscillatoriales cyanobact